MDSRPPFFSTFPKYPGGTEVPSGVIAHDYGKTGSTVKDFLQNIRDFLPLLPLSPFCSIGKGKEERQLSLALVARPNATELIRVFRRCKKEVIPEAGTNTDSGSPGSIGSSSHGRGPRGTTAMTARCSPH